jgi:hypothetical protein
MTDSTVEFLIESLSAPDRGSWFQLAKDGTVGHTPIDIRGELQLDAVLSGFRRGVIVL